MAAQQQPTQPHSALLRSWARKFMVFFLLLTLLLPNLFSSETEVHASSGDSTMAVHFLDVGQGLAIFAQSGGQNLIYDGGDRETSSFVVSYLQQQGVSTIDYLISSHYDSDHLAGLIGCLNAFTVNTVICSDYVHDSQLYDSFINTVNSCGLTMQHPEVGSTFSFGTGNFQILAPAYIGDDSNENSVAIKLNNGSNSFLFTGDAESASEYEMCTSGIDLDCDVLVPGHHGSATATSWDLLQACVPYYAVISCGTDNPYGHPDTDTMEKLESMGISVFRTDKQGTIVAISDGSTISWNTDPCNDYSPGDADDIGTQPESYEASGETELPADNADSEVMVWLSATGSKYHSINNCGRMNPAKAYQVPLSQAEAQGFEACSKCH